MGLGLNNLNFQYTILFKLTNDFISSENNSLLSIELDWSIVCHYQFRYKNSKIAILIVKNTIKNGENN